MSGLESIAKLREYTLCDKGERLTAYINTNEIADEIEAEIAERFVALPVDAIGESDAPKSEETVENDTSKDDIRNFDDSREKLEADVLKEKNSFFHTPYGFLKVRKWLDRQAAITRGECAECAESMGAYADRLCDPLKERIDDLAAERDTLMTALKHAQDDCQMWHEQFDAENAAHMETRKELSACADVRDKVIDERDWLREKCGRMMDAAQEVMRIGELD